MFSSDSTTCICRVHAEKKKQSAPCAFSSAELLYSHCSLMQMGLCHHRVEEKKKQQCIINTRRQAVGGTRLMFQRFCPDAELFMPWLRLRWHVQAVSTEILVQGIMICPTYVAWYARSRVLLIACLIYTYIPRARGISRRI